MEERRERASERVMRALCDLNILSVFYFTVHNYKLKFSSTVVVVTISLLVAIAQKKAGFVFK